MALLIVLITYLKSSVGGSQQQNCLGKIVSCAANNLLYHLPQFGNAVAGIQTARSAPVSVQVRSVTAPAGSVTRAPLQT